MDVSTFFIKLLILLVTAKIFAELFAYLKMPSVIGEVCAGIIIGPSLLGIVSPDATFHLLAEIGILLLLFEVGLDTDVGQLIKVGVRSSLVAVIGIAAPALLGFWAAYYLLNLSALVSLFIGGTLVATSIGITVRVLVDLKKHRTRVAKVVLGAAVIDDVVGVVMLALLYDFAVRGEVSIMNAIKILAFISAFLLIAPVVAKLFVPFIAKAAANAKTKGMIPTIIISLILLLAVVSHAVGAPEILGSFAAGIALARRFFLPLGATIDHYSKALAGKIEESMKPIIELFVPIFFVIVGASINLRVIDFSSPAFWSMTALLTAVAVVSKMFSGIAAGSGKMAMLSTGIAMVPRGEVGLIFAELGKKANVFDDMIYAVIVFVVAITTVFAPLMLKYVMRDEKDEIEPDRQAV
ncbi:MAG: cation:proton antiporter [Nitrospirae bacterium]|nr:cation:proton antiporter [Nitrospirota bacterium]